MTTPGVQIALSAEREAWAKAFEARDGDAVRAWWRSVEVLLRSVRQETPAVNPINAAPRTYPAEAMLRLERIAGLLAVGTLPEPVRDAVSEGAPATGPLQRRHMITAVAYRLASRPEGLVHRGDIIRITDPRPVQTLTGWFGVATSTLQGWVRSLCDEIGGELGALNAAALTSLAKEAGRIYRQAATSQAAIARRGRSESG